jgi:hypothetical protein
VRDQGEDIEGIGETLGFRHQVLVRVENRTARKLAPDPVAQRARGPFLGPRPTPIE